MPMWYITWTCNDLGSCLFIYLVDTDHPVEKHYARHIDDPHLQRLCSGNK